MNLPPRYTRNILKVPFNLSNTSTMIGENGKRTESRNISPLLPTWHPPPYPTWPQSGSTMQTSDKEFLLLIKKCRSKARMRQAG